MRRVYVSHCPWMLSIGSVSHATCRVTGRPLSDCIAVTGTDTPPSPDAADHCRAPRTPLVVGRDPAGREIRNDDDMQDACGCPTHNSTHHSLHSTQPKPPRRSLASHYGKSQSFPAASPSARPSGPWRRGARGSSAGRIGGRGLDGFLRLRTREAR